MSKQTCVRPGSIALAIGASLVIAGVETQASENPFAATDLGSGYTVASHESGHEGAKTREEGKCGEGKCGTKQMFDAMDANHDGKVSLEEHENYWGKQFSKTDADGSGTITKEEMKAAMKKHMSKSGEAKGSEGKCGEGKCGAK